ncbi:LysR substrate-binding domain-containing protein [Sphingomonas quercus]|uniref:LysR family transcriptional regulator n=1 Tax=Sphingomonas quercus TaxID=2842451 RepID=A0ABS6BFR9_9SPHN|nr:LysR substrate-binding domain-containing protein [Sphingomonas quercus]MBU3076677.1 LysR family transcriptional regulator [Sphingomonas quercus]
MELRHIRYFVTLAETLHFGRAADLLGMSQPPLSQQIRALEEELGARLFERTSRRVRLTEAGQLFLAEAERLLNQADRAAAVVRRAAHGERGQLKLSFTASVPLVPKVVNAVFAFRNAYPEVRLDLTEMTRNAQLAGLEAGELCVGFVRGFDPPPIADHLTMVTVLEEGLVVAMHRDDPLAQRNGAISIADLAHSAFVLYERDLGAGFNEHIDLLCQAAGFRPRVVQETRGLSMLLGLVGAGLGVTVISRSLSALGLENVVYRPLEGGGTISRLWMVHRTSPGSTSSNFIRLVGQS